jgi:hypothetical protein
MRGKVSRSVRIASLAVLAVLAVACTSSGGGQTITGSPIVSILSTQGPVNIGQNNKIEFHLLAGTSVGALRSRECPGEASQCWPDAGNPTGMLYLATGLTLGGCSAWTRISSRQPTEERIVINVKATSDRCPTGSGAVAAPQVALLGLPALFCPVAPIDVVVHIDGHLEQTVAEQPNRPDCD